MLFKVQLFLKLFGASHQVIAVKWIAGKAARQIQRVSTGSPSATNHSVSTRILPFCNDVRTAHPQTPTGGKFRPTCFQNLFTGKPTHLMQCRELDNSGHKLSNCFYRMPSQKIVAEQAIQRTLPLVTDSHRSTAVSASCSLGKPRRDLPP